MFDIKHCETRACLVEHSPDILTGIEERTQHVFFFATSATAILDEGIIPDDVFVLLLHEDAASW